MNGNLSFCFRRVPALQAVCAALTALSFGLSANVQQVNAQESTVTKTTPGRPPAAAPAAQPQPAPAAPAPAPAEPPAPTTQAAPAAQAPAGQPPAPAQQNQAAAPQPNPLGAGWSTKFGLGSPESSEFKGTPEQIAVIQKLNVYFNEMTNLEGSFLQTDADDKRKKGKFFIERPGKLRFDYSLPSKQKIISDGKYLALEDHDLNTTDRYPIESTPFRLLLAKDVDLLRDARIFALDVGQDVAVITLEDKASDSGGQIRLFFDWPQVQLREWMISDPQGLNTRIQVADVQLNKTVDPKTFKFSPDIGMPKFTP
jgi:outer membrane lipoprotein-sorting protein